MGFHPKADAWLGAALLLIGSGIDDFSAGRGDFPRHSFGGAGSELAVVTRNLYLHCAFRRSRDWGGR